MNVIKKPQAAPQWILSEWQNNPVYQSTQGRWTAIVSPRYGRLIALLHEGTNKNLLHFTPTHTTHKETYGTPHWGGHAVWLGPQSRWQWPPSQNWELSPAAPYSTQIDSETGALSFTLSAPEPHLPQLTRLYRWNRDSALECRVFWLQSEAVGQDWFAVQVFTVSADLAITLPQQPDLRSNSTLFFGPKEAQIEDLLTPSDNCHKIHWQKQRFKVGLEATSIHAQNQAGHGFTLSADHTAQAPAALPDANHVTQIYASPDYGNESYFELEQLSKIYNEPSGQCHSTVILRPTTERVTSM